jgi:hypothetical protein
MNSRDEKFDHEPSPPPKRVAKYILPLAVLLGFVAVAVALRLLDIHAGYGILLSPGIFVLGLVPVLGPIAIFNLAGDYANVKSVILVGLAAFAQFGLLLLPYYKYLQTNSKRYLRVQLLVAGAYLLWVAVVVLLRLISP